MSSPLTNLGLFGNFDVCDKDIIAGLNANFELLDNLVQLAFDSFVPELPEEPNEGDKYILSTDGSINMWDGSKWLTYPAQDGYIAYNKDDESIYIYDGSNWIPFSVPSVIEAQGDIIRGDAAGDEERLPIGTEGQVLKSVSGQAVWSDEDPISFFPNITISVAGNEPIQADQITAITDAYETQFPELFAQTPTLGSAQELKVVGTFYDTAESVRYDYIWNGSEFVPIEFLRPATDVALTSGVIFATSRTNYREFSEDTSLTLAGLKDGFTTICAIKNVDVADIEITLPAGAYARPDVDLIIPPDNISVFTFVNVNDNILVAVVSGMESV